MDFLQLLEWFAVSMGLIYIILLIKENIWCWPFGIVSSVAFIFLMFNKQLYSESILYAFYVGVGFYGWYKWSNKNSEKIVIKRAPIWVIGTILLVGAILAFGVGYFFQENTDAKRPFVDASTSVFSLLASFMEAHKWLSSWLFWIAINFASIWLYFDRSLNISSMLMVIYFLLSVFGFLQWKRTMTVQEIKVL